MQIHRGVQAYRQTDLQTMGKEKLIVLLYLKLLEHLEAAAGHAAADRAAMSGRLGRAQRIVAELRGALDHAVGGEIADNLAALYDFVFKEILAMQVDEQPVHADNCRRVLGPLLEAWQAIAPGSGEREQRTRTSDGTEAANGPLSAGGPVESAVRLVSFSV